MFHSKFIFIVANFFFFLTPVFSLSQERSFVPPKHSKIAYVQNQGQWQEEFEFKASISGGTVFLRHDGFVFDFFDTRDVLLAHDNNLKGIDSTLIKHHAWKVEFVNCNAVIPLGEKPMDYYCNYFLGNDPSLWKSKIYPVERVRYKNLWNGIDLIVYSSNGNFKYEFVIMAGADANQIQLHYNGIDVKLDAGDLVFDSYAGGKRENKPYCFQDTKNKLTEVPGIYLLHNNTLSFQFPDGYDRDVQLTIDPELLAATLIGIASGEAYGYCSTYYFDGSIIVGSRPFQNNLPTTLGAFDSTFNGAQDIGLSMFDSTGQCLVWCTFIGGSNDETLAQLYCTPQNELLVLGVTKSPDFPTTEYCFDSSLFGLSDVFVFKISIDGMQLDASTLFGDSGPDGIRGLYQYFNTGYSSNGYRGEIALDYNGNVVVGISTWSLNYPAVLSYGNVFSYENFTVFCISSDLTQLFWCTQIGTVEHEGVCDMEILANGNIALCGATDSDILEVSGNAYQTTNSGGYDGWIGIFNPTNGVMINSTFFGTTGEDDLLFIDEDSAGNLWVCGMGNGTIPEFGGGYSNPGSWDFIAKFNSELTSLELCSPIGSGLGLQGLFAPSAFMLDDCDRIYISGNGNYYALENLPITSDAIYTEGGFYLAVFETEMQDLIYGTYFGGDHIDGGASRFDPKGVVYQGVCSLLNPFSNAPFVAAPDAYSTVQSAGAEAAVFKIDFDSPSVVSSFTYEPKTTCVPYEVEFSNWSDSATYLWNFGDGNWVNNQDSTFVYTFEAGGDYLVQLAAFDINSCNVHDTLKVIIHVPDAVSNLETEWQIDAGDLCQTTANILAEFTGSGADSLQWIFDNEIYSEIDSLNFYVAQPGIYPLQLVAFDYMCGVSDTIETIFNIGPPVQAEIEVIQDANGCVPQELIAQSLSDNSDSIIWLVNDLAVENSSAFNYNFTQSGQYEISLVATNESSCNVSDTVLLNLEVFPLPEVSFYMPDTICKDDGIIQLTTGNPPGGIYAGEAVSGGTFNPAAVDTGLHVIDYTYTDSNNCSNTASASFIVSACVGVHELSPFGLLNVYPNPANDNLVFEVGGNQTLFTVRIWNPLGQLVAANNNRNEKQRISIDVRSWASGLYFFEVKLDDEKALSGKIAVKK